MSCKWKNPHRNRVIISKDPSKCYWKLCLQVFKGTFKSSQWYSSRCCIYLSSPWTHTPIIVFFFPDWLQIHLEAIDKKMRHIADRRPLALFISVEELSSAAHRDLPCCECKWSPAFLHTGSPNNKQMWRTERGTPAASVCVCSSEAPTVCPALCLPLLNTSQGRWLYAAGSHQALYLFFSSISTLFLLGDLCFYVFFFFFLNT